MAHPVLNVDVEYGEIEIAGVWYSRSDVNTLLSRLINIMQPRGWLDDATLQQAAKQGALDALTNLKADRTQHLLTKPADEWIAETDFIDRHIAEIFKVKQ